MHEVALPTRPAGTIDLRIFLDECSVEIFANDGAAVISDLIFPHPASDRLRLFAECGVARIRSLRAWELAQPAPTTAERLLR